MVRDFRAGDRDFFARRRPGPATAPAKQAARDQVLRLRAAGHSVTEITAALASGPMPLSRTGVWELLRAEGYERLPTRPPGQRGGPRRDRSPRTRRITWPPQPLRLPSDYAGVLLLVPEQLARLQSQLRPGDVVLVSAFASWQYAYYAPDRPTFLTTPPRWAAVPFTVAYPGRGDLVVVGGLDDAAIRRALADAAGRTKRIWVVLGHSEPGRYEEKLWDTAARSIGRVTKVRTGVVERFGPRQAELERPWLVEIGRQAASIP